jgi:hypothetical protein
LCIVFTSMKTKFYKCEECEQKFGRRWNATRHTKLIHGAACDIVSNDINNRTSYKSHNKYYNYQKKFDILIQAGIPTYNEYDENLSDIFNLDKEDFKIIKIIDQLIKPFNELEELLIDININEEKRALILTRSFNLSLQSHNPVNSMNEMIELLRSINGIKKIAEYKSLVTNTSIDPISDLKEKIKNSYIFKRQNN